MIWLYLILAAVVYPFFKKEAEKAHPVNGARSPFYEELLAYIQYAILWPICFTWAIWHSLKHK